MLGTAGAGRDGCAKILNQIFGGRKVSPRACIAITGYGAKLQGVGIRLAFEQTQ